MKRLLLLLSVPAIAALAACSGEPTSPIASIPDGALSAKGAQNTCVVPIGGVPTVVDKGFNEYGYNRCAHVFNGTFAGYCAERGEAPDCAGTTGNTSLIMKWNEEWDRGNLDGWTNGPYGAWLDNEIKGSMADGTPFSEHFKTRWDASCAAGNSTGVDGGVCIWGIFEVLMDQGRLAGDKYYWSAKVTPNGYGH